MDHLVGLRERLAERQPLGRQVVVAERVGLVGRVEHDEVPLALPAVLLVLADERELAVDAPGGGEVVAHLFLKRRRDLLQLRVVRDGASVQHCDSALHLPS